MVIEQRSAKRFAGRAVAAMVRQGCSPLTMRRHRIPQSVFYWTLGARAHRCNSPAAVAVHMIDQYRPDFLGLAKT